MTAERWDIQELIEDQHQSGERYFEFLRVPSMSAGVYRLAPGATDSQSPHSEDEVYLVLAGRGRFRCGAEDSAVATGSVLYVPALREHRFHSIEEELRLLVLFAPAEQVGD
ncbi:MAG: cupin domain-containing protein [Thermoplasmata archaeon]